MNFSKIVIFGFLSCFILSVYAQDSTKSTTIQFEKTTHDFGSVNESGPITYEFKFTNTGSEPLVINNVKASCGCTTPGWTKEPVMPGKTGVVTAQYNTVNRPGGFNKSLTVIANTQ